MKKITIELNIDEELETLLTDREVLCKYNAGDYLYEELSDRIMDKMGDIDVEGLIVDQLTGRLPESMDDKMRRFVAQWSD